MAQITIDGTDYNLEDLSDNARAQLSSIQYADQEINRLNAKLALMQTARNAYARALSADLPEKMVDDKKAGTLGINGNRYLIDDFSDNAKGQLNSLHVVDQKLSQLEAELAMAKTARVAYAKAVKAELETA